MTLINRNVGYYESENELFWSYREFIFGNKDLGTQIFNLGTGIPYSVLDMVNAFGKVCGNPIPYEIGGRRPGDVQDSWADASKAETVFGWKAQRGIDEMCQDAWGWQKKNPEGY